jgi:hypothetical protein
MPTDEERMQRSRDTVDEIHETVQRMIEDNKRWNKARDAEREAELVYRAKHGGKSKDEVWFKWIVGVPVALFVLAFVVFMYAILPIIINILIKATAEWRDLFH